MLENRGHHYYIMLIDLSLATYELVSTVHPKESFERHLQLEVSHFVCALIVTITCVQYQHACDGTAPKTIMDALQIILASENTKNMAGDNK